MVRRQDEGLNILREIRNIRHDLCQFFVVLVPFDVVVHLGSKLVKLLQNGNGAGMVGMVFRSMFDVILEEERVTQKTLDGSDQKGKEVTAPTLRKVADGFCELLEFPPFWILIRSQDRLLCDGRRDK